MPMQVLAHMRVANEVEEVHDGVAHVLLVSLEQHLTELRLENEQLQAA